MIQIGSFSLELLPNGLTDKLAFVHVSISGDVGLQNLPQLRRNASCYEYIDFCHLSVKICYTIVEHSINRRSQSHLRRLRRRKGETWEKWLRRGSRHFNKPLRPLGEVFLLISWLKRREPAFIPGLEDYHLIHSQERERAFDWNLENHYWIERDGRIGSDGRSLRAFRITALGAAHVRNMGDVLIFGDSLKTLFSQPEERTSNDSALPDTLENVGKFAVILG